MKPLMPPQRCACGRELPCFDHRPAAQTSEPQTEAGRALYEVSEHMTWSNGAVVSNHYILKTILAIESEAFMDGARASRENRAAIEAEAQRLAVERLHQYLHDEGVWPDDDEAWHLRVCEGALARPSPDSATEPHTAAGRRLHARIFGLSDRMPDGAELDNLILAIEAEAADHPPYPTPDEFAGMTHEQFVAFLDRIGARRFAAPASPDVVEALRLLLDEVTDGDRAYHSGAVDNARAALAALPADKPEPSAQAQPARLDLDAMRRAIHELRWCKEDRMHAFAHGDDPEDDELRERFAAAYAATDPDAKEGQS